MLFSTPYDSQTEIDTDDHVGIKLQLFRTINV